MLADELYEKALSVKKSKMEIERDNVLGVTYQSIINECKNNSNCGIFRYVYDVNFIKYYENKLELQHKLENDGFKVKYTTNLEKLTISWDKKYD